LDKVVLYGNGSVARATYHALCYESQYEVAGFTVDRASMKDNELLGLPVVPFDEVKAVFPPEGFLMRIAVGYVAVNKLRADRFFQAKEMGYRMFNYISPTAVIGPDVHMGENCTVGVNCVISSSVRIGDNVTISANTFIGHDVVIKDHCFLGNCVGIAGGVTIEPYCYFGINATVRNLVTIARECVIGAGALILQDTKEKEVYMGTPANLIPISSDELPLK
jgi:sugar O-acyltransferase (sialic acid O-acetyltransferase NeuD family)